ncbi:MAG: hypothetical protein V9G98_08735 [Candidatus Competibacter sp.]
MVTFKERIDQIDRATKDYRASSQDRAAFEKLDILGLEAVEAASSFEELLEACEHIHTPRAQSVAYECLLILSSSISKAVRAYLAARTDEDFEKGLKKLVSFYPVFIQKLFWKIRMGQKN